MQSVSHDFQNFHLLTQVEAVCIHLLGLPSQTTTDWVAQTTEIYFLIVLEAGSLRSDSWP